MNRRRRDARTLVWLRAAVFLLAGMLASEAWSAVPPLRATSPGESLDKLDLTGPALGEVRSKWGQKDEIGAKRALLYYYRQKYPLSDSRAAIDPKELEAADQIARHVFQWGPYEPSDYGATLQWDWDPHSDQEWVVAVFRFYWVMPLYHAFAATRNEKYARAFVELTTDWIAKYPLDLYREQLRGMPWSDSQTGSRATRLSAAFPILVHSEAFTPDYLGRFLAFLYDHQVKTMKVAQAKVFNKTLFEQRGLAEAAVRFPEFREASRWLETAFSRVSDCIFAQTTPSGVHREWCPGYHLAVAEEGFQMMLIARNGRIAIPDDYQRRVKMMFDYLFAIATPDLGLPMFGDTTHVTSTNPDRSRGLLYPTFNVDARQLGDSKYPALAQLDYENLPPQRSYCFDDAGTYVMRNGWGTKGIYLALRCAMSVIAGPVRGHDHPDSGTFELYAFGRCLMPDSGFYNYVEGSPEREWFRQTSVHQTLTLNNRDAGEGGKHLLWQSTPAFDVAAFENRSYPFLIHRRTVWFVNHAFFVILDDAIGAARGTVSIHFQLAPGKTEVNMRQHTARTLFDDANVLIWEAPRAPVQMAEEEGWYSPEYGRKEERTAFRYQVKTGAARCFVTLVVPYEGTKPPRVDVDFPDDYAPGDDRVEFNATAFGKTWRLGRDLENRKGWCEEEEKHTRKGRP